MSDIDVKLNTKANVKTRLEMLYYFIYEMAQSFGVDDGDLDSITKGILERKILCQIIINYKDLSDVIVGRVIIKIDWDKHTLLASTDYGAFFTLEPNKSIKTQVSEVSDIIIEHVTNMRKSLAISKIATGYRYIPEIRNDDAKYKEAQKYLGHTSGKKEEIAIQKDFSSSIEWLCDKLKEIKITVENS